MSDKKNSFVSHFHKEGFLETIFFSYAYYPPNPFSDPNSIFPLLRPSSPLHSQKGPFLLSFCLPCWVSFPQLNHRKYQAFSECQDPV